VARSVVEEDVLAERIRSIDARSVLASVQAVDSSVILHARIAAMPGGIRNFEEQVSSTQLISRLAIGDVACPPVAVFFGGTHEFVGNAHRVIGVLEENGT